MEQNEGTPLTLWHNANPHMGETLGVEDVLRVRDRLRELVGLALRDTEGLREGESVWRRVRLGVPEVDQVWVAEGLRDGVGLRLAEGVGERLWLGEAENECRPGGAYKFYVLRNMFCFCIGTTVFSNLLNELIYEIIL